MKNDFACMPHVATLQMISEMANVDPLPLEMLAAAVLAYARACVLRPLGQLSGTALWQGHHRPGTTRFAFLPSV